MVKRDCGVHYAMKTTKQKSTLTDRKGLEEEGKRGVKRAVVRTAKEMTGAERQRIESILAKAVGGEVEFDARYNGNCLVNAFAAGLAKTDAIFLSEAKGVGLPVVYLGAKTGRDGVGGATMASAEFDDTIEEKRPTVQVGDPFTEKCLLEACLELMETGAVIAIQDMGAAGLTCSAVEMGASGDLGIELDLDVMIAGLRDGYAGESDLTEAEIMTTLRAFGTKQREAQMARREAEGETNATEGAAFLATNAEREEVQVTESGLQYEVLTEGDGASPGPTDRVTVHYRGTLIDGTEFDSSYSRNEPTSFRVNGVIRGWTEALQMMNVGSKYKLYIPGDLAYGTRGSGDKIGPNSVLIFEVELLGIES